MRYLLDTHTLIWSVYDAKRVENIIDILENPNNEIFYSSVNIWEIVIKHSIDKGDFLPEEVMDLAIEQGFQELPVTAIHAAKVDKLKRKEGMLKHKDPFDMILVSQAKEEGMMLLTVDGDVIDTYDEPCIYSYK